MDSAQRKRRAETRLKVSIIEKRVRRRQADMVVGLKSGGASPPPQPLNETSARSVPAYREKNRTPCNRLRCGTAGPPGGYRGAGRFARRRPEGVNMLQDRAYSNPSLVMFQALTPRRRATRRRSAAIAAFVALAATGWIAGALITPDGTAGPVGFGPFSYFPSS